MNDDDTVTIYTMMVALSTVWDSHIKKRHLQARNGTQKG